MTAGCYTLFGALIEFVDSPGSPFRVETHLRRAIDACRREGDAAALSRLQAISVALAYFLAPSGDRADSREALRLEIERLAWAWLGEAPMDPAATLAMDRSLAA